jgi:hypothetical protein
MRGRLYCRSVMNSSEPVRLNVDFNYGGLDQARIEGEAMLYPKSGDRRGMASQIKDQFEAVGVVPADGMAVVLVDKRADSDEDGKVCDMVVVGKLRWFPDDQQWSATYEYDAMTWIPSESE